MLSDYYSDASVLARLAEFLGGSSLKDATAVFITTDHHGASVWYRPRPVSELWQALSEGLEVARSLWDRKSLLAHLDLEYVNFDDPAEAYLEPTRAFALQRPVVQALQEILLDHGVAPLHLLSGRGHHLIWRIARYDAFRPGVFYSG